jgi:hypothetical protein
MLAIFRSFTYRERVAGCNFEKLEVFMCIFTILCILRGIDMYFGKIRPVMSLLFKKYIFSCRPYQYFYYVYIHEIRKRKANWIGHILRINCRLEHIIKRKIDKRIRVMVRRQ